MECCHAHRTHRRGQEHELILRIGKLYMHPPPTPYHTSLLGRLPSVLALLLFTNGLLFTKGLLFRVGFGRLGCLSIAQGSRGVSPYVRINIVFCF